MKSFRHTILRIIAYFRKQPPRHDRENLLQRTSGLWKDRDDIVDTQDYVNQLRNEWDDRLK